MSDENNDRDINFFNEKSEVVNSPDYNVDKFNSSSHSLLKNSFSVLHINIRSMNKNFEKLHEYLSHEKRNFSIIALTETWCSDDKVDKNYTVIHQIRNSGIANSKLGTLHPIRDQLLYFHVSQKSSNVLCITDFKII